MSRTVLNDTNAAKVQSVEKEDQQGACVHADVSQLDHKTETISIRHNKQELCPQIAAIRDFPVVTADNLLTLSDHLEALLQHVNNMKELAYHTNCYPRILEEALDRDATELNHLYQEVKTAGHDIQRMKRQRKAVRKERTTAKAQLKAVAEEESKELKDLMSANFTQLYSRWMTLRNSKQLDPMEVFLSEIKNEYETLKILEDLVQRKMKKLQKKQALVPFQALPITAPTRHPLKDKAVSPSISWIPDQTFKFIRKESHQRDAVQSRKRQATLTAGRVASEGVVLQLCPLQQQQDEPAGPSSSSLHDTFLNNTSFSTVREQHPVQSSPSLQVTFLDISSSSDEDSYSRTSSDMMDDWSNEGSGSSQDQNLNMPNLLNIFYDERTNISQRTPLPENQRNQSTGSK